MCNRKSEREYNYPCVCRQAVKYCTSLYNVTDRNREWRKLFYHRKIERLIKFFLFLFSILKITEDMYNVQHQHQIVLDYKDKLG